VQGDIALVLSIDVEGNVSNVFVVSGNPELAEAAVGTARKWKYVPYDVNGKAVGVTTKVLVRFTNSQTSPKDVSVAFEMPTISSPGPVFSVGVDGVTAPKLISSVTPQYSEQARRDRYQGFCTLAVVIGPDGKPSDIRVTRPLGEGLDPKAIEAVRQWRFVPGRKDGKPVAVRIKVEVSFHLD
jgi:TonB family protein